MRSEEDEDDNSNESTAAAAENEYEHLKQQAVDYIKHPIMFETYSICKMAKASTLSKFSIALLDVAHINIKKKRPYIELLMA